MKKILSLVLSLIILSSLTLSANAVFFSGKYEIIFHTKQTYENTEYENIFSDHRNFLKTEVYGIDGIIHIDILAAFCSINAHQNPPVYILRAATTAETRVAAREIADELISLGITDNATVMDLDEFSRLSLKAKNVIPITAQCTVFAESEVISLVGEGKPMEEIAAGIETSVAKRCFVMAKKAGAVDKITLTGGCAKNDGLKDAIEKVLRLKVIDLPIDPQLMGALGAAEFARQKGMAK